MCFLPCEQSHLWCVLPTHMSTHEAVLAVHVTVAYCFKTNQKRVRLLSALCTNNVTNLWSLLWFIEPDQNIDGFHSDVIRLQSQKSKVLRILIYTRLNRTKIENKCLYKFPAPKHVSFRTYSNLNFPSFHSAWHQNRNAVSLKKSLSSWFSAV